MSKAPFHKPTSGLAREVREVRMREQAFHKVMRRLRTGEIDQAQAACALRETYADAFHMGRSAVSPCTED